MKRAAILLPLVFTVFGVAIMWESLAEMVFFNFERGAPGPGFLPFWVSLGVVCLGGALTVRDAVRPPSDAIAAEWPDAVGVKRVGFTLASLALLLVLFKPLGFPLASLAFMLATAYGLGFRPLKVLVPVCAGFSLAVYLLFVVWLRVSLPMGPLELVM